MQRTVLVILAILLPCLVGSGCANLQHKAFAIGGSTSAFKIVMGTDPETGNPLPVPQQVILGWGSFFCLDMPMVDDGECWYYNEEPNWFRDSATKTFVYMRSGNGKIKGHIKVEIDDKSIVNVPIFKLYNPVAKGKEVKIDGEKK